MNYQTLIIAGLGTIGSSVIRLGQKELGSFQKIIGIDKETGALDEHSDLDLLLRPGDIKDENFLRNLLRDMEGPALFVNLCADMDNVRIRKTIAEFDVAYLDSCASAIGHDPEEYRFSRLMPYTHTPFDSSQPHWLCWGINPGMVEIIARKIIRDSDAAIGPLDVSVFEYDQLRTNSENDTIAVGWCPKALVEEMMLSPTLQIADGAPLEGAGIGTEKVPARWNGEVIDSRIVGHEDIWNMAMIDGVESSKFVYALQPEVMETLDGEPREAVKVLQVPPPEEPVFGLERVAVVVEDKNTAARNTLVWEVDHQDIWRQYGVNGVQYQTGKSMLLAILLLQKTRYGRMPATSCAADLPINESDWQNIETFMKALDIQWNDGQHLGLGTLGG